MAQIVIDRDHVRCKWTMQIDGQSSRMIDGLDHSNTDAHDVVRLIQLRYPKSKVGVVSAVFGLATKKAFGPIVWMREREHVG